MPYASSVALLPTRTNVNPTAPDGAEYVDGTTALIVLENDLGKHTVVSSHGGTGSHLVGDRFVAHHDQAGYTFRTLEIIGMVDQEDTEGNRAHLGVIPNRKLALRVYK